MGTIVILNYLMAVNSDLTIPIMLKHLTGPSKPSLVMADIISALLEFRQMINKHNMRLRRFCVFRWILKFKQ